MCVSSMQAWCIWNDLIERTKFFIFLLLVVVSDMQRRSMLRLWGQAASSSCPSWMGEARSKGPWGMTACLCLWRKKGHNPWNPCVREPKNKSCSSTRSTGYTNLKGVHTLWIKVQDIFFLTSSIHLVDLLNFIPCATPLLTLSYNRGDLLRTNKPKFLHSKIFGAVLHQPLWRAALQVASLTRWVQA